MHTYRVRVYAVLLGIVVVLAGALLVGVPDAAEARPLVAATGSASAMSGLGESGEPGESGTVLAQEEAPPGPTLDPQNEADAKKNRSRLIVAVIAAVLLGIVIWGRHVRKKNKTS